MIAASWKNRWAEITPFLAFPEEIRRAIYTTNAIEALNRILRKTSGTVHQSTIEQFGRTTSGTSAPGCSDLVALFAP